MIPFIKLSNFSSCFDQNIVATLYRQEGNGGWMYLLSALYKQYVG